MNTPATILMLKSIDSNRN